MVLPLNTSKKIDKALELIWAAKDKLNQSMTEDEMTMALGQLKRAENILTNVCFELSDAQDDE